MKRKLIVSKTKNLLQQKKKLSKLFTYKKSLLRSKMLKTVKPLMIYRLHTSKAFCTSQKLKINFIHKGKVTLRRFGWCTDTSYRPTNDAPLWQVHEVAKSRRLTALALPVNTRKQSTSKMKLHFFLYFLKNYDCITTQTLQ